MEPNIQQLKLNYAKFDNDKLIKIATEEVNDLRPEAIEVLFETLKERGVSENIYKSIIAQIKPLSNEELEGYCNVLRNLNCPICGNNNQKLNATIVGKVTSYIFFTNYDKSFKIACTDCLDKLNKEAVLHSALFGWWGFPHGIINTFQSFSFNSKMKKSHIHDKANELFKTFVSKKIGEIEAYKDDETELYKIIENS